MKRQIVNRKIILLLIGLMTLAIQNIGYAHTGDGNPHFDNTSTTRSVAENTASNRNIGAPVTAEHGSFYRYHLTGTDAGSFSIVSNTGNCKPSQRWIMKPRTPIR